MYACGDTEWYENTEEMDVYPCSHKAEEEKDSWLLNATLASFVQTLFRGFLIEVLLENGVSFLAEASLDNELAHLTLDGSVPCLGRSAGRQVISLRCVESVSSTAELKLEALAVPEALRSRLDDTCCTLVLENCQFISLRFDTRRMCEYFSLCLEFLVRHLDELVKRRPGLLAHAGSLSTQPWSRQSGVIESHPVFISSSRRDQGNQGRLPQKFEFVDSSSGSCQRLLAERGQRVPTCGRMGTAPSGPGVLRREVRAVGDHGVQVDHNVAVSPLEWPSLTFATSSREAEESPGLVPPLPGSTASKGEVAPATPSRTLEPLKREGSEPSISLDEEMVSAIASYLRGDRHMLKPDANSGSGNDFRCIEGAQTASCGSPDCRCQS